jgi:quinol monooxygenase YgiN
MYVVTVEFVIAPGRGAAFLEAMTANARTSRAVEPGCRQFDVCIDPADPRRVFLYELYDDPAAFGVHVASPHFKAFDATVKPWIESKTVHTWGRLDPA